LVGQGNVFLSRHELVDFVLNVYIENLTKNIKLIKKVDVEKLERNVNIKTVYELSPPCIKKLIERALAGDELSHQERLVLLFYLINTNCSDEDILKIYSNQPDFDEKKTKYFISHARKHKYKPYNCSNMKLFNLCIKECNVKNPIVIFSRNARKKLSREKSTFQNHTNQNHKQQKY